MEESRPSSREWAAIALILLLAAALRLAALGRDGLWADECYGALKSLLPIGKLIPQFVSENEAPLYQLVQMPFASHSSPSEWWLRLPSALLGIMSVGLLWALTRRIVSPGAGLVAAFLLAISPLHVHYSREARNYALLAAVTLLAVGAILRLARRPTKSGWIALGISLLAVLYTHDIGAVYSAGVVIAGVALSWRHQPRRAAWAALAIALVIAVAGYSPRLSASVSRTGFLAHQYDWLLPAWQHGFPWQIGHSLAAFSHGSLPPIRNHVREIYWTAWPALGLSLLLVALGLRQRKQWRLPQGASALIFAILTPLIMLFLYSLLAMPIYSVGRVDSAALPFFLILISAGVAALPSKAIRIGALVAFTGLALLPLQVDVGLDTRSQERSIARHLAASMKDGDALVMACSLRSSQEFYLKFWKPRAAIFSFPAEREKHHFWLDWDAYAGDSLDHEAQRAVRLAMNSVITQSGENIWVMLEPDPRNATVLPYLSQQMEPGPITDLGYLGLKLARFRWTVQQVP